MSTNEKWKFHSVSEGSLGGTYRVTPEERKGWEYSFMEDRPYYPCAPEPEIARHIVDVHNFVVEHGGLESVRARLRELQALEDAGVDNWVGYSYIDWAEVHGYADD